jgi:hypothetical protein
LPFGGHAHRIDLKAGFRTALLWNRSVCPFGLFGNFATPDPSPPLVASWLFVWEHATPSTSRDCGFRSFGCICPVVGFFMSFHQ